MHVFGHPVEMDELVEVADDFGIAVIEDAAEALGSQYKGRQCAAIGLLGAVSFNGNTFKGFEAVTLGTTDYKIADFSSFDDVKKDFASAVS